MRIRLFGRKVGEVDKGYGLSLKVYLFESGLSLHIMPLICSFFISLPRFTHRLPHEGMESWGATKRFKWAARVRRSIDVRFSDEVGAERGSWKGGCVGCGYDMQPGDTPLVTLRRMEFERRFR